MTLFKTSRIGRRIGWLVAISVLMSILTISSLLVWLQVSESIESRKNGLRATGYVYAAAIAEPFARGDKQQVVSVLSSIGRVPGILYAAAVDSEDRTVGAMGNAIFLQRDFILEEQGAFAMLTKGTLPVAVDIVRGGERTGRLVLIADVRPIRSTLLWTLLATAMAAVIASIFGAAIAIPLQRRITVPILSVVSAMRHIKDARDYSTKVSHKADDETGVLAETFNSMISEISTRDTALEKLAYFDPLTGLPNRLHFQKKIDEITGELGGIGFTAGLFLLDLDEFKQINDAFGHTIGDALLKGVAAALTQEATDDCTVARLGGDEFVIIAANVSSEREAQERLAPFIAALYKPIRIIEHEIHVSTSVGVAMIARDGMSSDELMRRADLALYSAKRQGPGQVHFYHQSMNADIKERAETAQALHHAIANNEFETHYQPQFDLKTGSCFGFECLIRWKHPERGYISPDKFIPVAENSGLISKIGSWIIFDSCSRGRSWLDQGQAEREISVNVSVVQLLQADFQVEVKRILRETGFPPYLLCLEVTESLFIGKSIRKAKATLENLKLLGVSLALDDFGTGYSSLSYLEKLPFDKIKIDRSFVSGIETDANRRSLLGGIIALGQTLGRIIIAEGAETAGEVSLLRELGADIVQGFALSRPLPADDAIAAAHAVSTAFSSNFGGNRQLCNGKTTLATQVV